MAGDNNIVAAPIQTSMQQDNTATGQATKTLDGGAHAEVYKQPDGGGGVNKASAGRARAESKEDDSDSEGELHIDMGSSEGKRLSISAEESGEPGKSDENSGTKQQTVTLVNDEALLLSDKPEKTEELWDELFGQFEKVPSDGSADCISSTSSSR